MNPPLNRISMAYKKFKGRINQCLTARLIMSLVFRRFIFFGLVFSSTWWGWKTIATILTPEESAPLSNVIIIIFTVLFGWISATFWTVLLGLWCLFKRSDSWAVDNIAANAVIHSDTKIAIIMPVYNEDVQRIFAGIEAMYESLEKTGQLSHFDFFILSDSNKPEQCQREREAWLELSNRTKTPGKIFYRHRKLHLHKKSGNVSDFCRRWGKNYTYLLPLDADSLMGGKTMVDMVRILESRPEVGIVQTSPKGINQRTLMARLQQFTSHMYGPLHLAGSHFWELCDAGFWGHNALIRLKPFIEYCALPKLGGKVPFGGEILSHDFVEAALMRRAGYGVWLAYNLDESYEELPPNLIEELRRDNRWSQGNLQHLRMIVWRGFSFGHRILFLNGNMAYFSAALWFLLLVLMTAYAAVDFFYQPQYFPTYHSLFPHWPAHNHDLSRQLLMVTVIFLFGPKLMGLVWIVCSGNVKNCGGIGRVMVSVLLEIIVSIFLAPIKMVFHTWFILTNLFAKKLEWNKQQRDMDRISFPHALSKFGFIGIAALGWGFIAAAFNQSLFFWLLPILIPLVLAVPVVVLVSSREIGQLFVKAGIFLTPIETNPPDVVVRLNQLISSDHCIES